MILSIIEIIMINNDNE